jgi:hypothetical protein
MKTWEAKPINGILLPRRLKVVFTGEILWTRADYHPLTAVKLNYFSGEMCDRAQFLPQIGRR